MCGVGAQASGTRCCVKILLLLTLLTLSKSRSDSVRDISGPCGVCAALCRADPFYLAPMAPVTPSEHWLVPCRRTGRQQPLPGWLNSIF